MSNWKKWLGIKKNSIAILFKEACPQCGKRVFFRHVGMARNWLNTYTWTINVCPNCGYQLEVLEDG